MDRCPSWSVTIPSSLSVPRRSLRVSNNHFTIRGGDDDDDCQQVVQCCYFFVPNNINNTALCCHHLANWHCVDANQELRTGETYQASTTTTESAAATVPGEASQSEQLQQTRPPDTRRRVSQIREFNIQCPVSVQHKSSGGCGWLGYFRWHILLCVCQLRWAQLECRKRRRYFSCVWCKQ